MDLSIIIVSWNTQDLLRKCLNSIYQNLDGLNLEIFVVDNNSSDKTAQMVKAEFPQVNLITNNKNLGFAKANNQAIKQVKGEYLLLLNPDTEILNNGLIKSLQFMKSHQSCGVMGPKMLFEDKSLQPSVRRWPRPWPIFLMLIKAQKFFKGLKAIDYYLYKDFDYNKEQAVDQVMGAFMLIPKEVMAKVGLLDERFFIWFEEVDFCKRVWQNGYSVIYNPDIQLIHYGGRSFSQQPIISKQWQFFKSALKYFLKHGF